MNALQNLQAADAALGTKLDAAIVLVESLPNNDVAIQAVADSLTAKSAKIDAVITSLTPTV